MIYLASPYSSGTKQSLDENYEDALQAVYLLARYHIPIYSPIVHFHNAAKKYSLHKDYGFWSGVNNHMISLSEMILILQLEGWQYSTGVKGEVTEARRLEIPVRYITLQQAKDLTSMIIIFREKP